MAEVLPKDIYILTICTMGTFLKQLSEQNMKILNLFEALFITYCISSVIRQSFSFQNNPQNLDPTYKLDLDLWDCLGSVKLVL